MEVNYANTECRDEYELMQMDIPLIEGCGTLSPQWFVKCDLTEAEQVAGGINAFDYLQVTTGDG